MLASRVWRSKAGRIGTFGLRGLLLAITACCAVLAIVADEFRRERAAEWVVRHLGGSLCYKYQVCDKEWIDVNAKPPGPAWLRNALGDGALTSVAIVCIPWPNVKDEHLGILSDLRHLELLELNSESVSDKAMSEFKRRRPKVTVRILHMDPGDCWGQSEGMGPIRPKSGARRAQYAENATIATLKYGSPLVRCFIFAAAVLATLFGLLLITVRFR